MRRAKKSALIAVLLLLAAALLAYKNRMALFVLVAELLVGPRDAFDPAMAPPPPDYADPAAWAALPAKADASDWRPPGLVEADTPLKGKVDLFYIHPTGYITKKGWNAAMHERSRFGIPTEAMLASQASAFNHFANIYAPEYRQATLYAFLEHLRSPEADNGKRALDLAYTDIAAAFDYFIAHYNEGRPFILASHSQGTTHALRLLAEKIDSTELHKRLIAAYLIGFNMPSDYFTRVYRNVKPCTSPEQTGCVIHWDTFREGTRPAFPGFHRYPEGWESAEGKARFGVNPLTWTSESGRAPAEKHLGALLMKTSLDPEAMRPEMLTGILPHATWAENREGLLWVRNLVNDPYPRFVIPAGIYHNLDYHIFWMNIRQNALARAQRFFDSTPKDTSQ